MRLGLYGRKNSILNYKKRRIIKRTLIILGVIFLILDMLLFFFKQVYPNYIAHARIYANNQAMEMINKTLWKVLDSGYENQDFLSFEYNDSGYLVSVTNDAIEMNRFKADIIKNIQDEIEKISADYIYIPLGSLLNEEIFAGLGPSLKVKIIPNGNVKANFIESFSECGINQVKHKIDLNISVSITLVSATMHETSTVNTDVPVIETVVSGVVPNYYGDGMGFVNQID